MTMRLHASKLAVVLMLLAVAIRCGAVGDGQASDTAAIQKALDGAVPK
jgi:hypothetical protein